MSHQEADVVINGVTLTFAQAMTLRVAVAHMLIDMQNPKALGEDQHGLAMTEGYRFHLQEIERIIFKKFGGR